MNTVFYQIRGLTISTNGKITILATCLFFFLTLRPTFAQEESLLTTQSRADVQLAYFFNTNLRLNNYVRYIWNINEEGDYIRQDYQLAIDYNIHSIYNIEAGTLLSHVKQDIGFSSFEYRFYTGLIIQLLSGRINITNRSRLEYRNQNFYKPKDWAESTRIRNRLQIKFPFRKTLGSDKAFYGIVDGEIFYPVSQKDLTERYANTFNARIGLGYRRDFNWRYTFYYVIGQAKNNLDAEFETTRQVFNFQLIYFFDKNLD
ncbi:DUF2490 domain-containing protein [Flammeovirgaceae bacterium SG7u.111]|nr:DUF2490 domain-containing protein [Flammeovirgaceae bacterium SG7u.132]WPO35933.1 DUF2490 domain-containing protein [Flammeovirgaceae bacterium SG7u.111]